MCSFIPNLTTAATSRMILNYSLTSESDYVQLMWNSPQYHPERYQLTYVCVTNSTSAKTCSSNIYFVNTRILNLSSDSSSVTFIDLDANSICVMKLVAFFNPASIDSGIVFTVKTIASNTSK